MGGVPAVLYTGVCGTPCIWSVFRQATYNTIKQGQLNPNQFNCTLVRIKTRVHVSNMNTIDRWGFYCVLYTGVRSM